MDPQWDKKLCNKIRGELGLSHEVAMAIVGEVAEHRQTAYLQGYNRGFNKNPDACGSPKPHDEDTISKRFYNYRQSWWFDIVVAYRSNKFRVVIERNAFNDQSLMCGYGLDLGALRWNRLVNVPLTPEVAKANYENNNESIEPLVQSDRQCSLD